MATTSKENPDPTPKSTDGDEISKSKAEKKQTKYAHAPVDRSKYVVFLLHMTEEMNYTTKWIIEVLLDQMIDVGLSPLGIMRNGDTIEVTFKDPTEATIATMARLGLTTKSVDISWLRDDDPMVIVNIRGNDFRHPLSEAVDLVKRYGIVVHCYRQLNEYRGRRLETGIISVWMRDVHTVIPLKFDKRRSCFYNKGRLEELLTHTGEKSRARRQRRIAREELLTHTGAKTQEVPADCGIPPVKEAVLPSPEAGGTEVAGAASVETPVLRQVMIEETGAAAASMEPAESRQDMIKDTEAATDVSPETDESHEVASDGERHHQCGICSKKFRTLDHLKRHAWIKHADATSDGSMDSTGDIRPGVERTPASDAQTKILGTKVLRDLRKQEQMQRHTEKHSVKVKKKAAQLKKK